MARSKISKAPADPVRPYLEGVAKNLVDRLYGPKGPAWGTKLTELEDVVLAVRQVLSEQMLHEALQRQANTVYERPSPVCSCAQCGKEVVTDEPEPRILQTPARVAELLQPLAY